MRLVFMGTPDYATRIFEEILKEGIFEVPLLVTQKDKPVGRKQVLTPPHIKKWVEDNSLDIDIYQPDSLKTKEAVERISSYKPDIIVVAAYGKILPKEILDISPCINLHASILPKYRGASPIQSAILNQESLSGVTAMMMEEGLDSGDILAFRYVDFKDIRVDKAFDILSEAAAKLCIKVLKDFKNLKSIKQLDFDASKCVKIKKENGLISFAQSALDIYRKYLAYTPWPGLFLENGLKLKELKLYLGDGKNSSIGRIEKILDNSIVVTCKEGMVEIVTLQAPSKKAVNALEYIRGKRIGVGDILV